jgi:protein-S-isoprenylcysteine O-methyltransferase Ste14
MGLDIRVPIGLMFTIFGLVLTILGLVTNSNAEMYKRSLDININLWSGLVILVFGILMLIFALRGKKNRKK